MSSEGKVILLSFLQLMKSVFAEFASLRSKLGQLRRSGSTQLKKITSVMGCFS